jgi:hypothetical protein
MIFLMASSIIVYAASHWIYSPVKTETIEDYALTLTTTSSGLDLTFSGNLTLKSIPQSAKTIYIFHCAIDGTLSGINTTEILTTTTLTDGSYSAQFEETSVGTYHYKAGSYVP